MPRRRNLYSAKDGASSQHHARRHHHRRQRRNRRNKRPSSPNHIRHRSVSQPNRAPTRTDLHDHQARALQIARAPQQIQLAPALQRDTSHLPGQQATASRKPGAALRASAVHGKLLGAQRERATKSGERKRVSREARGDRAASDSRCGRGRLTFPATTEPEGLSVRRHELVGL